MSRFGTRLQASPGRGRPAAAACPPRCEVGARPFLPVGPGSAKRERGATHGRTLLPHSEHLQLTWQRRTAACVLVTEEECRIRFAALAD